ncbi:phosphomannomutase/phosphoglucomutase [soil metagenome]
MTPDPASVEQALATLFHAYDVRGPAPSVLTESVAEAIGRCFAAAVEISDGRGGAVVGRDMRVTSPGLSSALIRGITAAGADVIDIGLAATDMVYFASGQLSLPAVMVKASHNPAGDNGFKLSRAGARPIGRHTGLDDIRTCVARLLNEPTLPTSVRAGAITRQDVLPAYVDLTRRLVPVTGRAVRVVVDAANAMAALTVPAVFGALDVDLVPLYFELDGSFPNHPADPLDPANLVALQASVVDQRADLGLAFDGDADRCFVIDELGQIVSPSVIAAMIAERELARHPGATILYNVVCSRVVPDVIAAAGGVGVRTAVGHAVIKAAMVEHGAVFGGEHSGHFYFRDFWSADSGMLAALHVLAVVAGSPRPLSQTVDGYRRYVASGEINSTVPDAANVLGSVEARLRAETKVVGVDHLDGLTMSGTDWWFNLRASNTEPLVRLNVEAEDSATMGRVRDSVLTVLRSDR